MPALADTVQHRLRRAGANLPLALTTLILGAPIIGCLLIGLIAGGGDTWTHIADTFLWSSIGATLALILLTGLFIAIVAIPAAWLVTMYRFPGRDIFGWLLILPLAAPGYVLAFSYSDMLGVAGPIQSFIREASGLSARDYWFPNIRSLTGCAFVMAAALYPYVYLTARAAFSMQSTSTLEAAQLLGAAPRARFWRVALPAARPAIAAGLALALMETAADYGAADFLGVRTLTVSVYRAWASFGDAAAGARLALILVSLTLFLQWLERWQRGAAGFQASTTRWRAPPPHQLTGLRALWASAICALIFSWGFGLPVYHLIAIAVDARAETPPIGEALWNSVRLAGLAAVFAFALSLIIALGVHHRQTLARLASLVATSGYAMPGAVLALGALFTIARLPIAQSSSAALGLLILVYVSRFAAAGIQPMQAALQAAPASYSAAARSLGASPTRRILQLDLPIIAPGAAAAALILFVETLKELPATLMLRPFNWDTLAVRAYVYASDERLPAAALPSLAITLAGLLPVILLSRQLSRARRGQTR
jgi:iron(III) transport system permease protein